MGLLRSFKLPRDASVSDLKKAYFREAKKLHPDSNPQLDPNRATREFTRLRADYEEAVRLLEGGSGAFGGSYGGSGSSGSGFGQSEWSWQTSDGYAGFSRQGRATGWSTEDWRAWSETAPPKKQRPFVYGAKSTGVPVVGFPTKVVYPLTGLLLTTFLVSRLWRRHKEEMERPRLQGLTPSEVSRGNQFEDQSSGRVEWPGRVAFREALEREPQIQTRSLEAQSSISSLNPPRPTRRRPVPSPHEVSPHDDFAVHDAAAHGRVWWLELCGATPSCRPGLYSSDFRDDTPLHQCAKHGQVLACRTLLRLGADPSRRNRFGLAAEHLAAHGGHEDLATLLTGVRRGGVDPTSAAATRLAKRHPDGFGHTVSLQDEGLPMGSLPSESLRHAVNAALGESLLGPKDLAAAATALAKRTHTMGAGEEVSQVAIGLVNEVLAPSGRRIEVFTHKGGPEAISFAACDYGLLGFEQPGKVTPDAPGHWFALRPLARASLAGFGSLEAKRSVQEATVKEDELFQRLDPVRGIFILTSQETQDLLLRYTFWRIAPGDSEQ